MKRTIKGIIHFQMIGFDSHSKRSRFLVGQIQSSPSSNTIPLDRFAWMPFQGLFFPFFSFYYSKFINLSKLRTPCSTLRTRTQTYWKRNLTSGCWRIRPQRVNKKLLKWTKPNVKYPEILFLVIVRWFSINFHDFPICDPETGMECTK